MMSASPSASGTPLETITKTVALLMAGKEASAACMDPRSRFSPTFPRNGATLKHLKWEEGMGQTALADPHGGSSQAVRGVSLESEGPVSGLAPLLTSSVILGN